MPKAQKDEDGQSISITNQATLRTQSLYLCTAGRGVAEITFNQAERKDVGTRGKGVAELLKATPNLRRLIFNFSGHLHSYSDCLGPKLLDALCSLKHIEEFHQGATNSARTDFGQYELMKLVSSWPKLRILYLAGDSYGSSSGCAELPPATCKIETVTFERCMASYETLAPMFAGSGRSLKSFEAWTMGHGDIDHILLPILGGLETLQIGGVNHPTPDFILTHLSKAPKLHTIILGGNTDPSGVIRGAFAHALSTPGTFTSLKRLGYPAQDEMYNSGRGRKPRTKGYDNPGEEELLDTCHEKGIQGHRASDLEYKVEGNSRRAVFAAMGRRGY